MTWQDFLNNILFDPVIGKIVTVVAGITVIYYVVRRLQQFISRRVESRDTRFNIRRVLTIVGYILAIIFIIGVFSDQLRNITVALGVAGAGIAFALQEVIASIAGWIILSFGQFYHIGDRIEVKEIKGDVIDISAIRTTLMEIGNWIEGDLYTGRIVRIPNSYIFKEAVFNYSADFPFVWDEIRIPIKYGSDHRLARQIITDTAASVVSEFVEDAERSWSIMMRKFRLQKAFMEPRVTLKANDNWMEFTLFYLTDYKIRRSIKDKLFSRLMDEIEKTNGKVSLASATFQIVGLPQINVRLDQE
jgi:small-conductance mechanosensitive channel